MKLNKIYIGVLLALIVILGIALPRLNAGEQAQPLIEKGFLNLSDWDFSQ